MEQKRQKVRYECYTYNAPNGLTTHFLKLNNPAEVKFIGVDSNIGNRITINNSFVIQSLVDVLNGTAVYPSELILNNNENEIDVTQYTLLLQQNSEVFVVCKYYVIE